MGTNTTLFTSMVLSDDSQYIYISGALDGGKYMGVSRYTISSGVFENYKISGLTTNAYTSSDYLLMQGDEKIHSRLATDGTYLSWKSYSYYKWGDIDSYIARITLFKTRQMR